MSELNGDKSRFGRERQKKLLRRERSRASRHALEAKSTEPETAVVEEAEISTPPADLGVKTGTAAD